MIDEGEVEASRMVEIYFRRLHVQVTGDWHYGVGGVRIGAASKDVPLLGEGGHRSPIVRVIRRRRGGELAPTVVVVSYEIVPIAAVVRSDLLTADEVVGSLAGFVAEHLLVEYGVVAEVVEAGLDDGAAALVDVVRLLVAEVIHFSDA